ncbi:MAG TPA: ABC transporter substrate-binding protein [Chloroflexota bacterium]|nr:ABC transporter substrate-binding protein [Chloroflexota bacterium]
MVRRRSTLALGPAALLALQAGHRLPLAYAQTQGGTFVFGRGADSASLDPAVTTDGESFRVTDQIMEPLVAFEGSTTELKPGLATGWDISADGLTYTFRLREGVKFHDGTDLDAAAVKWNFERWGDEEHPYHTGGDFEYYNDVAAFSDTIKSVEVADPLTVVFTLNEPSATFLVNLALPAFGIASPTALMADIGNAYRNPVGTGPFKFVEWVPDDRIVLERNPTYWGQTAHVERVVVRSIPDNAARFLALQSGSIDMFEGVNPDDLATVRRDPSLSIILRPSLNVAYINMNLKEAPFNLLKVRQAIAAAINRQAIVEALYQGTGTVASQLIPPHLLGWNPDVKGPQYNPDLARRLLAEAGYPNGFTTDFWYMPETRAYYPSPQPIAEAFAADLARVGIRANLKTEDWAAYLQNRNLLKYPIWMLGWIGDNGDTDNFLYYFFGNYSQDNSWDNPQVRDLLRQARVSVDRAERDALYRQVNAIVEQEVPRIPIAHTTPPLLARAYVKGYMAHPTQKELYHTVWLDR